MFIAQFFKASSLKKIRQITLIVWVLRRVKKMPKKVKKNEENFFCFVLNKYHSVTHVSASIFQGLFKNLVFRSVACHKKGMVYFRFFFS